MVTGSPRARTTNAPVAASPGSSSSDRARPSTIGTTTDAGEAVGGRRESSADPLRQLDDDPLRAADIASPLRSAPPRRRAPRRAPAGERRRRRCHRPAGGGGTGKTLLAVDEAERLAGDGRRVLRCCRSPNLARFLKRHLETDADVCPAESPRVFGRLGSTPDLSNMAACTCPCRCRRPSTYRHG